MKLLGHTDGITYFCAAPKVFIEVKRILQGQKTIYQKLRVKISGQSLGFGPRRQKRLMKKNTPYDIRFSSRH